MYSKWFLSNIVLMRLYARLIIKTCSCLSDFNRNHLRNLDLIKAWHFQESQNESQGGFTFMEIKRRHFCGIISCKPELYQRKGKPFYPVSFL